MPQDALRRRLLWALAALCLVTFTALAPHLVYPDLNLDYPFVDGDSYDWIANGLHLAGHEVRYSGRPPLLPLALGALDRLGILAWWPLFSLLLYLVTVVGFYDLAARLVPPAAAFAAALLLLADYSLLGLALEVMADVPAACLLLWSVRAFLIAAGDPPRPRSYAWSGLLAGLSAVTQAPALLLPLAAGATLAARRRRDLRSRWPWIGALLAVALPIAWMLVRRRAFASYGDALLDPWILVGFHLSSWPFYLWSLLSLLGLPAGLLLAAGIVQLARRASPGDEPRAATASLFALLAFALLFGFFAFFYRYDAKRFLVYAIWSAALLIAAALAPLAALVRPAGRLAFAAVAALAIAAAALPLPEPAHGGSWVALWPLPPVAAHLAMSGSTAADRGALAGGARRAPALAAPSLASLPGWSAFGRASQAWAGRPRDEVRPHPALFAAAGAALYLFDRPDDGGGRYRTLTRLSNALHKPVRYVPRSVLARYWPLLSAVPLARLTGDYAIYRATLPGIAGSWLLVTPGSHPLDAGLLQAPGGAGGAAAERPQGALGATAQLPAGAPRWPLPPGQPARALVQVDAIRRYVGSGNAYVVLIPATVAQRGANLAQLYLLFLLETTELYVVEPPDVGRALAVLASSPPADEQRIGNARLARTRVLGRRTVLISFVP